MLLRASACVQVIPRLVQQFVFIRKELGLLPLLKEAKVFVRALSQHESAAGRDFDGTGGLPVTVAFAQETEVDVKSANGFCVVVTPTWTVFKGQVCRNISHPLPGVAPNTDWQTGQRQRAKGTRAIRLPLTDKPNLAAKTLAVPRDEIPPDDA